MEQEHGVGREAHSVTSDEKLMAAICYWCSIAPALGFVAALIIFLLKKDESPFLKKQSLQCLVLNLAIFVIFVILSVLSMVTFGLAGIVVPFVYLAAIIYFIILGFKAFQGEDVEVPYLTNMIQRNMSS